MSEKIPQESDIEPVLKEMREFRKGTRGGKRHARQREQHKRRYRGRNSMACARPEF